MCPCPEPRHLRQLVGLLLLLLVPMLSMGQSRKELEKKREALDKQIKTTTALIDQARKEQRVTQQQLQLLESQIQAREQLIRAMNGELRQVDHRIQEDEEMVTSLRKDLVELKEEYARMVQFAYRNRSSYDRLSYLFAANSFQQAFKRSRYLNQIAQQRVRQAALIAETQASIEARLAGLREQREAKNRIMAEEQAEKQKLAADRNGQQSALASLKKEEGRLKETQRRQQKQRNDLDAAIRKAIEESMRKETKPAAKGASAGTGGSTAKLEVTLTPEAKELNTDFEKNKGKLPWPVEKGVITSRYGKQPHPVLPGIVIENNGIDITTEKGAGVRAVFRGEVSSVIVIPGAGKAVIVSHGAYRTVYSNLRDVSVVKGQKVETKQVVGTVLTDDNGSVAHIEIWKITSEGLVKVDPALWIYR
jgi:septal ring factor EnvC (AmiA/AmiB activator)